MANVRTRHNSLDWLLQVAYTTWRLFMKNELMNHAAATSFYFLLSAAPLVLLVSYAIQWLARQAESSNLAAILLTAFYEQFHLDDLMAMGFIPSGAKVAMGSVGIMTLLLSSRGLVNAVQSAFRVIFPADWKRRFVISWALPLVIIPLTFLLVLLAVLAEGVLRFLVHSELLGTAGAGVLHGISFGLAMLTPWGLIFTAYWRLPLRHPSPRQAALMAFIAAMTLVALTAGFGYFFSLGKYRAVYGALGGVVFILIGTYFACLIFYFWAQCLYALSKVDVAALEKLFLGDTGENPLEAYVFGRCNRLVEKYGQHYAPGDTLITEGDSGNSAFFLYSGQVELFKQINGQPKRLGHIEQGQLFGEMAYLLGEARTATVVATEEVVALVLPPAILEELMRYSAPLSRRIIGTLCQRLQHMNEVTAG